MIPSYRSTSVSGANAWGMKLAEDLIGNVSPFRRARANEAKTRALESQAKMLAQQVENTKLVPEIKKYEASIPKEVAKIKAGAQKYIVDKNFELEEPTKRLADQKTRLKLERDREFGDLLTRQNYVKGLLAMKQMNPELDISAGVNKFMPFLEPSYKEPIGPEAPDINYEEVLKAFDKEISKPPTKKKKKETENFDIDNLMSELF